MLDYHVYSLAIVCPGLFWMLHCTEPQQSAQCFCINFITGTCTSIHLCMATLLTLQPCPSLGSVNLFNHVISAPFQNLLILTYVRYCVRADSRYVPNQWETSLQSIAVSHWLGANLDSALSVFFTVPCMAYVVDLIINESQLVERIALCHQATTIYYLWQFWPIAITLYDITRPQWVNLLAPGSKFYHQTSNKRHTKSQKLHVSCLSFQLSLHNPLKPGVKSRMKILQLHLGDQQFYCLLIMCLTLEVWWQFHKYLHTN